MKLRCSLAEYGRSRTSSTANIRSTSVLDVLGRSRVLRATISIRIEHRRAKDSPSRKKGSPELNEIKASEGKKFWNTVRKIGLTNHPVSHSTRGRGGDPTTHLIPTTLAKRGKLASTLSHDKAFDRAMTGIDQTLSSTSMATATRICLASTDPRERLRFLQETSRGSGANSVWNKSTDG